MTPWNRPIHPTREGEQKETNSGTSPSAAIGTRMISNFFQNLAFVCPRAGSNSGELRES
jgi:hypothetical protein